MEPSKTAGLLSKSEHLYGKIAERLADAGIKAFTRMSKKGTPHLVVEFKNMTYSIIRFEKVKKFAIFYPWPSSNQTKVDAGYWNDVVYFFLDKKLISYMRAFDDPKAPDGAWEAQLHDCVPAFNESNKTKYDPLAAFLIYCTATGKESGNR